MRAVSLRARSALPGYVETDQPTLARGKVRFAGRPSRRSSPTTATAPRTAPRAWTSTTSRWRRPSAPGPIPPSHRPRARRGPGQRAAVAHLPRRRRHRRAGRRGRRRRARADHQPARRQPHRVPGRGRPLGRCRRRLDVLVRDPGAPHRAQQARRAARPARGRHPGHRPRRRGRVRRQGGALPRGRRAVPDGHGDAGHRAEVGRGPRRAPARGHPRPRPPLRAARRVRRRRRAARRRRRRLVQHRGVLGLPVDRGDRATDGRRPAHRARTSWRTTGAPSAASRPTPARPGPTAGSRGPRRCSRWRPSWTPAPGPSGWTRSTCGAAT